LYAAACRICIHVHCGGFKIAAITEEYIEQNEVGIIFEMTVLQKPVIEAIDIIRKTGDTGMLSSGSVSNP